MITEELYLLIGIALIPGVLATQGYYRLLTDALKSEAPKETDYVPQFFNPTLLGAAIAIMWLPAFVYIAYAWLGVWLRLEKVRAYVRTNPSVIVYCLAYVVSFTIYGYYQEKTTTWRIGALGVAGVFLNVAHIRFLRAKQAANK